MMLHDSVWISMIGSNDGIYIDAPIIIDEPEALTFLHSTKPMILERTTYVSSPTPQTR